MAPVGTLGTRIVGWASVRECPPSASSHFGLTQPTINVVDETASTVVIADPDVREFIRAKGGAVYAWIGPSGFMKVAFRRPPDVEFIELQGEGFSLFQDETIAPPAPHLGWHVSLRRWPIRRVKVEYAMPEGRTDVDWIEVLTDSQWP